MFVCRARVSAVRNVAVLLPLVVLAVAACSDGDPCLQPENEPAYGGSGNDEVWLTLTDARSRATAGGDAATITSPLQGATLPSAAPATFTWESPLKVAFGPVLPTSVFRRHPPSVFDRLSGAFIPKAHAHLPPVTSDAYLVDFIIAGRECPVSVVTTELSHTLDEETWSKLTAADGTIEMNVTSAYLASGRVTEGPFAASSIEFKIE